MFIYMHSCKFTAQKLFIIKSPYVNTLCKCRYIHVPPTQFFYPPWNLDKIYCVKGKL